MTTIKDEPAFPTVDAYGGITKREFFAAVALLGLLQNPEVRWTVTGSLAVDVADNLIQHLNKQDD
jgi:hypothetical protein